MVHAIKKQVTVQEDDSIQIYVPEFKAETIPEVIILESPDQDRKKSMVGIIGKGKGSFATSYEADMFISNERRSLE